MFKKYLITSTALLVFLSPSVQALNQDLDIGSMRGGPKAYSRADEVPDAVKKNEQNIQKYEFIATEMSPNDINSILEVYGKQANAPEELIDLMKVQHFLGEEIQFYSDLNGEIVKASKDKSGTPTINPTLRSKNQKFIEDKNKEYNKISLELQKLLQQ